jgi:hypothetical protein
MVVPERHNENNSSFQSFINAAQATLLQKIGAILGLRNPILAEIFCDSVVLVATDSVHRMFNGLAILMVKLLHFFQLARVGVVLCDELRCDLNWLGSVNLKIGAWAKEFLLSKTIRLHVAPVLVTDALESITRSIVTTVDTFTASLPVSLARMHCKSSVVLVGLPNVDLSAATPILASS